jgi:hemerythrin-like domain-containing protein
MLMLSREAQQLEIDEEQALPLFMEAVDYIVNFQNIEHHPREELMFAEIGKKSPDLGRKADKLNREHRMMGRAGKKMLRQLQSMQEKQYTKTAKMTLVKSLAQFADDMRFHIRQEEDIMYSQASSLLSDRDWKAISSKKIADDPLKPEFEDSFPLLSEYINSTRDAISIHTRNLGWYDHKVDKLRHGMELASSQANELCSLSRSTIRHLPLFPLFRPRQTWKTIWGSTKEFRKIRDRWLHDWRDWREDPEWRLK